MADKRFEFSSVKLDVGLGKEAEAKPLSGDDPFRIVILGDFSGRGGQLKAPVQIDRDNFDDVLNAFAPEISFAAVAETIVIRELDDFHPDCLLERQPFFAPARSSRRRSEPPRPEPRRAPSAPAPASIVSGGSLLEGVLQVTEGRQTVESVSADPMQAWVDRLVAPHLVAAEAAPDSTAISEAMRALLRTAEFRSLEALWRSIYSLVRRTDTDGQVSLWLVDIARNQLDRDFAAASSIAELPVHRAIRAKQPALLIGAYSFGVSDADLATLTGLGAVAGSLGTSCIVGAEPQWIGCESYAALENPREWAEQRSEAEAFRSGVAARFIGLAGPRFLVRLPYGAETDACESFPFEEMGDGFEHDRLLWGNSAILCAGLLAESFNADGWDLRPGRHSNVSGLPLYTHEVNGDTEAQPCAETLMTDERAHAFHDRGVMCVASIKDSDSVRVVRFQNASKPPGALAGPWA